MSEYLIGLLSGIIIGEVGLVVVARVFKWRTEHLLISMAGGAVFVVVVGGVVGVLV